MVALWAEVQRTGVTGREAHGCPCLRPQPPPSRTKGRVARQQLFKSERVHVYVCVCASCQASVRLICGNVKSREVPTKPFLPPSAYHRHGTGPQRRIDRKK